MKNFELHLSLTHKTPVTVFINVRVMMHADDMGTEEDTFNDHRYQRIGGVFKTPVAYMARKRYVELLAPCLSLRCLTHNTS